VTRDASGKIVTSQESQSTTTNDLDPVSGDPRTSTQNNGQYTGPDGNTQGTVDQVVSLTNVQVLFPDGGAPTVSSDAGPLVAAPTESSSGGDPVQDVEETYLWHNAMLPVDVNGDALVSARDALLIIDQINESGSRSLRSESSHDRSLPFLDVNRDGLISPIDALLVITQLNKQADMGGEGEHAARAVSVAGTASFGTSSTLVVPTSTGDAERIPGSSSTPWAYVQPGIGNPVLLSQHGPQVWEDEIAWGEERLEEILNELSDELSDELSRIP
jgi:hypothetical protein